MMAECTELERQMLDRMGERDQRGIAVPLHEIRMQILISRITPELFNCAVKAARELRKAREYHEAVWKQMHEFGIEGNSKAFDSFWDSIEAKAREPQ